MCAIEKIPMCSCHYSDESRSRILGVVHASNLPTSRHFGL